MQDGASSLRFGADTFGDVTVDADGAPRSAAQSIRDLVEQGVVADRLGLDAFGVGEHHRADFAVSAPEVVLAAIAARTERIVLGTAVTVLSSDDPVRVYERFATLDALSSGRAELTLGRGSFTESFPLFGFRLEDYEELFEEKLELMAVLLEEGEVRWRGRLRPPIDVPAVHPRTERGRLPAWVGVGGSPESVVRAARLGFPLALAIIGGDPVRFAPYAQLFRRSLEQLGREPLPVAVHSPGHVAESDAAAREQLWPHYAAMHARIGAERGWPPMSRDAFEAEADHGALYVGSPDTVATKIVRTVRALGVDRFDLKYANGTMPHAQLLDGLHGYAEEVVPRVRAALAAP